MDCKEEIIRTISPRLQVYGGMTPSCEYIGIITNSTKSLSGGVRKTLAFCSTFHSKVSMRAGNLIPVGQILEQSATIAE